MRSAWHQLQKASSKSATKRGFQDLKEYVLKIIQNGREVWTIENENIEPKPTQSQDEVVITAAALLWQADTLRKDLITTFKMDPTLANLSIIQIYNSLQKTGIVQSEDLK